MVLEIVQLGHPVLRQKCDKVDPADETLPSFVEDMLETMYEAQGVGLAAPQVAVAKQLAVIDVQGDDSTTHFLVDGKPAKIDDHMPLVFMNPELSFTGNKEKDVEGCLSIKGIRASVKRPEIVVAKMQKMDGSEFTIEANGLLGRAIQHEVDHLNGILFIDRLSSVAKLKVKRQLAKYDYE